jgi:hypothetical protein
MGRKRKPWEVADDQPVPFWIGCRCDDPGLRNPDERLNGDSVLALVQSLDADGTAYGVNFMTRMPFKRKRSKGKPVLDRYYLLPDEEGEYRKQAIAEDLVKYGERKAWEMAKQLSLDYYHAFKAEKATTPDVPPPPVFESDSRKEAWEEIVEKNKRLKESIQDKQK